MLGKMFVNKQLLTAVGIGLAAFCSAIPGRAIAVSLTYQGNTTNEPTWRRTIVGDPPTLLSGNIPGETPVIVPYSVYQFAVDQSGLYTFSSTVPGATTSIDGAWDNFLVLYQNSFDPTAQLKNILIAANAPNNGSPVFNRQLTTGQNYFLVTTGRRPNDFGAFTNNITLTADNNNPPTGSAFTYQGDTTGAPKWFHVAPGNPPQIVSSSLVPYKIFEFTVDQSGLYNFSSKVPNATSAVSGNWDNFLALYQDSFQPTTPLINALAAANAPNDGGLAFNEELTTGKKYLLVTSGRQPGDFGTFINTINGPGKVKPVPEPNSISGTLAVVSLSLLFGKFRRNKLKAC